MQILRLLLKLLIVFKKSNILLSCGVIKTINDVISTFVLVGDNLMSEMHLRHHRFAFTECGPFTKNKEQIQKFRETGYFRYL